MPSMKRPTAVSVFAILNIVFGALGILCTPLSVVFLFLPIRTGSPILRMMNEQPVFRAWMIVEAALGIVAAIVLLVAGIGLLRLRPWARIVSIGYGVYAILNGLLGMVTNYIFILMPMAGEMRSGSAEALGAFAGLIGGLVGGCLGLVYPVLLIIFMNRPRIRAAFATEQVPVMPVPPTNT